jgi:integrase
MAIDDLPDFMEILAASSAISARGLEFLILTAARTSEVIGLRSPEIDFERRLWTVPAERMKAAREHRVPLSDRALAILADMAAARRSEFVFPGEKPGKPLSIMAFDMTLRRMGVEATVHGFRSTFRDWASERTSFPHEVCEMALAHAISNKSEAAYRRGDLLEKRRQLMAAWARYCTSVIEDDTVVEMHGRQI